MKIGVSGLGTIGSKLIEYLSEKGFDIIAYCWRSKNEKQSKFVGALEKKVQFNKVKYEDLELIKNRVVFSEDINSLQTCPIIIESMKEDYTVKKDFYKLLYDTLNTDFILATTTSCLSLEKLAENCDNSRFLGLHFFNPPTKMKLVELSFLNKTSDYVKKEIYRFMSMLDDKKVIEIPPIQGYIVNTLLFVNINYAMRFHIKTNIPIADIDVAMKLGTNAPMGPFELSDYIGNDVSLQILNELYQSLGDEIYKPEPLLEKMVEEGYLGRKKNKGFYTY